MAAAVVDQPATLLSHGGSPRYLEAQAGLQTDFVPI